MIDDGENASPGFHPFPLSTVGLDTSGIRPELEKRRTEFWTADERNVPQASLTQVIYLAWALNPLLTKNAEALSALDDDIIAVPLDFSAEEELRSELSWAEAELAEP